MNKNRAITNKATLNRLIASIRNKALESSNIAFSEHAIERAIERNILLSEVVRVLQFGAFSK